MVPSPSRTCLLAGRTATSLASINGVPASTSTSRFSTTSPSKAKLCLPRVNERRVSPRTLRAVCLVGGLGGRLYVSMERSDEGETNHITCGSTV